MTYQKVVKSLQQKFRHQSVKMSLYTSLSDYCNSILSSRSVDPFNAYRHFGLKIPDVMGTYRRTSNTVLSCIVFCVRISEQDV